MNLVDWAIVAVLAVSVVFGLIRGLVREVLALAGWIVGIWLAIRYAAELGALLPADAGPPAVRAAAVAAAIVLAVVIAAALLAWALGKLVSAVMLGGLNRGLGALFGLARGVLIVLVVALFAGRTALAQQPQWRGSLLLPHFEAAVRFAAPLMPSLSVPSAPRPA